ncbi:glycoside hydrolase family 2 [Microlunatus elymi]|uniref:Glycoside hydrolase family 2 n=1 Tax=Microlunatus elymi TaxID=2596828 RepID=A0A516PU74_9ACTN|nr:sugar-binding domain-containing protein [Microlunatus elymi]QDP94699.1 glycoside hydrolase family 2 [Microlunatus elymi]
MSIALRASQQDGSYPRPQLLRPAWTDLSDTWSFRYDDEDRGLTEGWRQGLPAADGGPDSIVVPFPPESVASGIGDTGFHPVVWYARNFGEHELSAAGEAGGRTLLHFGAVDYFAEVWLNGQYLGDHEGGNTPFSFDVTDALVDGDQLLVVRAYDDPHDLTQPRGKQDWHRDPHAIWYHRTTGIWQPVWLERVPATSIAELAWIPDLFTATVRLTASIRGPIGSGASLRTVLDFDGEQLAELSFPVDRAKIDITIPLPRQRNGQGYDEVIWTPEQPRLVDAAVQLVSDGTVTDEVNSYLGLRSAVVDGGHFLLNDRPYDVRSVLNQGYWPDSHLAAPSAAALRREVELIKELGFNAARIHQKVEDPRFLFWADKLGLLVWGEIANAYEFSFDAVRRLAAEWTEAVRRDLSHPCIVSWVPINESWGVQHNPQQTDQQAYQRALADLTRALDPSRPVLSNEGWEHQNSDIIGIHDYQQDAGILAETYARLENRTEVLSGVGPAGRRIMIKNATLGGEQYGAGGVPGDHGQPIMLTEFGGISYAPDDAPERHWGYSAVTDADTFRTRLTALYDAVRASRLLSGSCYTQLTDTLQETNGLLTARREPKLPMAELRKAILGD